MAKQSSYIVGGTVPPDSKLYISRQADEDLLALCRDGEFAYVLTSRQMGKSSLMVRTAKTLAGEAIRSVISDLNAIGTKVESEQWYVGLLFENRKQLALEANVNQWWQAHTNLGFAHRLTLFFKEVLLSEVSDRVVIFVDEIDSTIELDFTDDFYAAIRSFYNARPHMPEFKRLSFVLIGVAMPSDLINQPERTPFNIGRRVDLSDFTFEEVRLLATGLGLLRGQSLQVLSWILKWTGGHPYLTQRLCQVIAEQKRQNWSEDDVDQVVDDTFLGEMSKQDHNLQFVDETLTRRRFYLASVISRYRAIRLNLYPVPDEGRSASISRLKLSGIVRREGGILRVRNLIYERVFDRKWIEEVEAREQVVDPQELARLRELTQAQQRRVKAEHQRAQMHQRRAEAERQRTEEQRRRTEVEYQRAVQLRWLSFSLAGAFILAIILAFVVWQFREKPAKIQPTATVELGAMDAWATAEAAKAVANAAKSTAEAAETAANAAESTANAVVSTATVEAALITKTTTITATFEPPAGGTPIPTPTPIKDAAYYTRKLQEIINTKDDILALAELCNEGSLDDFAGIVLPACERAVELAPTDYQYLGAVRDTRGIARVLAGNFPGAIEDFEFAVEWLKEHDYYEQGGREREAWIVKLKAGQNPFDAATLEKLRNE